MRLASTLLLTLMPALMAQSQTTTPARKPVAHRTAAAASTLPPNIPKIPGITKSLYSLKYIDAKLGTGPLAEPSSIGTSRADSKVFYYTVRYTGWLAKDGTKFDSSFDHPGQEPITFPQGVRQVIPGWDTGFDGMHVGGTRRIFIPWQLAYGEKGRGPIPPRADLIFDMELVSVSDKQPAPAAPPTPLKPAPEGTPATPSPTPPASSTAPTAPKVQTDPASNDPAKATTPDNAPKPAPKPAIPPPTR